MKEALQKIIADNPTKIICSNPKDKTAQFQKVVIVPVLIKGKVKYQLEKFTEKQVFHENIDIENLYECIEKLFKDTYMQLNAFCETKEWELKISKKGKLLCTSKNIVKEIKAVLSQNREKNHIIKEGMKIPPLVDLGVLTKEGKVVNSKYDKFKQINRFIEMVDDVIRESKKETLHIIDFGCGKSYLTFVLYYYLTEIKKINVSITGLDLKADVIEQCNMAAKKYGYHGLCFEVGDINHYRTDKHIDMVITLHACDTATDYALYNAICWNTDIILSVPCCQHELNGQIYSEKLSALTKYGIIKEQTAALMTDAIRGSLLEACGYKTQLLEFIDIVHSPKNILIRAIKENVSNKKREQARKQAENLMEEFSLNPTLFRLINDLVQ